MMRGLHGERTTWCGDYIMRRQYGEWTMISGINGEGTTW